MALEHVNRKGDRYFVYQGKTKTGKARFFASKQETSDKGVQADALPEDFEIFEHPSNASITVRRKKASQVLPAERELIDRLTLKLTRYSCVQTIIDGNYLVVYTPDTDPSDVSAFFGKAFGSSPDQGEWTRRNTSYSADLRFELVDVDQRLYTAERFCYLGDIDNWILIGTPAPLEKLATKFLPHLGKESFFELI